MLIYSLPAPFFIDRPIDHERAKGVVRSGIQRLESTGVDFIAMPCNTAHVYYDSLAASVRVPLLNIITDPEVDQAILGFSETERMLFDSLLKKSDEDADPFAGRDWPPWSDWMRPGSAARKPRGARRGGRPRTQAKSR